MFFPKYPILLSFVTKDHVLFADLEFLLLFDCTLQNQVKLIFNMRNMRLATA